MTYRQARIIFVCLSALGTLAPAERCIAQTPISMTDALTPGAARLDVHPHEMATGTTNPAAGEYPLKSASGVLVSVPKQCVGAHRCPMFVFLPGGGISSREMTDWLHPVADKYGMILFAPTDYDRGTMNAAMKETLGRFAIDPDKIAVIGRCASGGYGMRLGLDNLNVFSRIVSVSGDAPINGMDPTNKTAEFLIDNGLLEDYEHFEAARGLRKDGHPVKVVLGLRGHEHQMEDYDFVGHWLQESWAKPDPATRTVPNVTADPLPTLTTDVLTQMTTFWTSFAKEPDSIRTAARREYLHEVIVPVANERPSVWMADMSALATRYPSVAADFKGAGLTPKQYDAYRCALISARIAKVADGDAGAVDPASALAKNVEFMKAHPVEFKTLQMAGVAHPDQIDEVSISNPKLSDARGALGIWRTP